RQVCLAADQEQPHVEAPHHETVERQQQQIDAFALDHLAAKKERHWCSSLWTATQSKESRQVAVIRNAKVRNIRKPPSIVLFGRAPYPNNPAGLRNRRYKFALDAFLYPGVVVKALAPKQPPFPAQRAAHKPLSRQRREAVENYKMRLGNIRQTPI